MTIRDFIKLIIWLLVWQLPSILGVQYVYPNMAWYRALIHPLFSPPGIVFGITWSVLYIMLGMSSFFVFRERIHSKTLGLLILQLVLNACWTPVFFGAHSLGGALLLIVAMAVACWFLIKACYAIRRLSAWLLLPYGLWLLFATYLTAGTWWLN